MRFTYGQISSILVAGGAAGQSTDMDAGEDANQITLYVDQQAALVGASVVISALVASGSGGGSATWKIVEARALLDTAFGPTTKEGEGLLLTASAPNTLKWRIEFRANGEDVVVAPALRWVAVCGRSETPGFLPQLVHRATAALPAAGAWTDATDTPNQLGVARFRFVTWAIAYTRGAAGGYPKFRAIWADSLGNEFQDATVFPSDVTPQELDGPVPPDANAQSYLFVLENLSAANAVRLEASEGGAPATPGALTIWMSARTG